jgi:predicted dehydrogenase
MNDPTRLVIAGIGLVGKRHVDAIRHLKHVELIAIVDPSDDGRQYANEHGLTCYTNLTDMFQNESPDGVVLSTPTPLHVEQGLECIENGCAAMVEKPLATSAHEAAILVDAAEKAGVPLLVGHHRRHNPLIQKVHESIMAGEIGQIRAIHANCWFYKPDHYFDIAPWRKKRGAGPISVNLVHDVDLIRYFCGEIVSVQAQATPSVRGFENEDVAAALLLFENGAIGTITVSDSIVSPWSWEMTSGEYPVYPKASQSCYHIGGSHGSLSIPDLRRWSHKDGRDWWQPIIATNVPYESFDPLIKQMDHFAAVISGRETPLVSGREGLKTLQVVEAIQIAAGSGESVMLEDIKIGA